MMLIFWVIFSVNFGGSFWRVRCCIAKVLSRNLIVFAGNSAVVHHTVRSHNHVAQYNVTVTLPSAAALSKLSFLPETVLLSLEAVLWEVFYRGRNFCICAYFPPYYSSRLILQPLECDICSTRSSQRVSHRFLPQISEENFQFLQIMHTINPLSCLIRVQNVYSLQNNSLIL